MKRLIFLALLCLFVLGGCANRTSLNQGNILYRWDCSSPFALADVGGGEYNPVARVCTDKITGNQYLYIWAGAGNGGPAVIPITPNNTVCNGGY